MSSPTQTHLPAPAEASLESLSMDEWSEFVDGHPDASIFHHRRWLELFQKQYGFAIRIEALKSGSQVHAAIPFLETRSLRGKKKLISLPFTDYLQLLGPDHSFSSLCLQVGQQLAGNYASIIVRSDRPIQAIKNESANVLHELKTDMAMEVLEKSFASSIKRNLKKGERHGLKFQLRDDIEALNDFFQLHVLTRRKLGVPVQTKRYFKAVFEKLIQPGLGFIAIVHKDSIPIASGVLLGYNRRLTYKYAASDPAALEFRPNDWLVFNAIRKASELGYKLFDFGITDKRQEGLRRFKDKWGATEREVFYSYIAGAPNGNNYQSRIMKLAATVIQRSPTFVCRGLGKALYKYSQ